MQAFYLGIDVSKGYADFVILDQHKKIVESNFQLDDTFKGHCTLYEVLLNFFKVHGDCALYAAVESTGGYELNWYECLRNFSATLNIKVARLNPYGVNKNSLADLKRNKTDKISARDVAEYLITHSEKVCYQQKDLLAPLKEQWNYIKLLTKQKTQLLSVLEKNIYKANPEILSYCKNGVPMWILKLLKQFPTAKLLAEASKEQLSEIPYLSRNKAEQIIASAQQTVASVSDPITAQRISDLVDEIVNKITKIDQQKKQLEKSAKIVPEQIRLLCSFKGIGTYSAVTLLILIGDVHRFADAKKIASFFGLHPVYKKSGDGAWGFHMSKKGNSIARHILYMIAISAINSNPLIKKLYIKQLQKGHKRMFAIGVCMHKILRIVYGMLKNNQPFNPEIDHKNSAKYQEKNNCAKEYRNRRFQKPDDRAPISRRQNIKRKTQKCNNMIS